MHSLKEQIEQLIAGKSSKAFVVLLKAQPELLENLIQFTDKYSPKNFSERLWIVIHGAPPVCCMGNKRQYNTWDWVS